MKTTILLAAALVGSVFASPVTFVPPNDTTGHVFSTNSNDGYGTDRGIVFQLTGDTTLSSVGIFQDLTNIDLTYYVYQIPTITPTDETGFNLLQTGTSNVTTNGLEWIDFAFSTLSLTSGNNYYVAFSFTGSSNQNFFYDNNNVVWTQGIFDQLDGANGGDVSNSVVSAIRLDGGSGAVTPEPGSILLAAAGLAGLACFRKRRSSTQQVSK